MKTRTSLSLSLIVILSIALAPRPIGAQSGTAPTSAITQPPARLSSATTAQPPEPTSKDQAWKTWEALPLQTQAKVDSRLLAELRGETIPTHLGGGLEQADLIPTQDVVPTEREPLDKTRFLVYLKTQADLKTVTQRTFASKAAQRTAVLNALLDTAQATQGPVKALLETRMSQRDVAAYQPFYIFNGLAVEGDLSTIIALAQRDDVERIVANYPLVRFEKGGTPAPAPARDLGGLDSDNWNIDLVDAERVWNELGVTGQGAVVANIDTGVDYAHPALVDQYRGNVGNGTFVHDYNWFDPDPELYPNGDLGPSRSDKPFDHYDHGTHTMGTMVGDGGIPGTQVGMAPDARWIAISLNEMSAASSIDDDIMAHKAFQWMLCPTDLSGALASADCSQAPDVVNNSWGSANPADDTFRPDLQALRAAGVAPVFSAGNPSVGPGSIGSPGSVPEAITVGATDANDEVADFSGRGPSFYEDEQKPELSAPGVDVKSTVSGGYYIASGTSMAAPHVAGLIALMVSADLQDGIRHFDVDELERFMMYAAADLGAPGPDDDYGYGRIEAYDAVRWVRSAGDLSGAVRDAASGGPIVGATIAGVKPPDTFTGQTDASGHYAVTVPGGDYDVSVGAWGYYSDTFSGQMVITGALSIADFSLSALPTTSLTGRALAGATPISGALVYVADQPAVNFVTGADGVYTLTLPPGAHDVVVQAPSHRILREDVSVASGGSTHDFFLTSAPTILLVDADAFAGWFIGWPVHNYFQWALDEENYLYDTWLIQDTTFNDTLVMVDGSIRYGVPSTTTLRSYDLVIWAHTGYSPGLIEADDELATYLDNGGRLILSGQDVGLLDNKRAFYDNYLHANFVMGGAAGEGDTVSGQDFLTGLNLEITNASLYGYPNGALDLLPDAVAPRDGAAFPVLTYDNGNGIGALAVDPCDVPYRAVYFALSYENIAPRADNRDPAIAELLDRSIVWAMDDRLIYSANVFATPSHQVGEPGSSVTYDLQIANRGHAATVFELTLSDNTWPTCILSGTTPVTLTLSLAPCSLQDLTLEVDIPTTANSADQDTVTITARPQPGGAGALPDNRVAVTTVAFPSWQKEPEAPYAASRVSLAAWENSIYLMGGDGGVVENHEFDACTEQWVARAPIPVGTLNHAAAAMDGKIYVAGGAQYEVMDNLQIYDIASDSWSAGAPMPEARWAHTAVALDGEIYVIGGRDDNYSTQATVFAYNPASDSWRAVAPMSNPRSWVAGAALNGRLYVVGGTGELNTVEEYNPVTDTWTTKSPMLDGRAAPGVASAQGYLYVAGGGYHSYLPTAERYNPTTDTWERISNLNTGRRTLGMAYAAGKVFAANGWYDAYSDDLESLPLSDAFCLSDKYVWQSTVQPGERITYTVEIHTNPASSADASLVDPIPAGTTFAGLGVNPIGAAYNSAANQIEWSGVIPASTEPLTFTFGVDVVTDNWAANAPITNAITFDSGVGLVFSRTATTRLDFPNASPSFKTVDKEAVLAGDVLTYTIHVQNGSIISDAFVLHDSIPANATYVPGSLTYTLGSAGYDPASDAITWTEMLPLPGEYINTRDDYEWSDSDGNGSALGVTFDWIDVSATGANAGRGDELYYCDLPIGFTFDFYGTQETTFCASTNGFLSFDTWGYSDHTNDCPLPHYYGNAALIAAIWDDLVLEGGIYYQTFGTAPNRYLVVQWHDARHYYTNLLPYFDFEIILYEGGNIKMQMLEAGPELGAYSTTGIEAHSETEGITYACNTENSLHDNLAVVFLPPGGAFTAIGADLSFAVTTASSLPANTWITNTATIAGPYGAVERSASTAINPVDLGASHKRANKTQAAPGEVVTYDFVLRNTGLLTATSAMLDDPLPATTTYAPGSLACSSGSCGYAAGVVTWSGDVPPGDAVTLTFAITLSTNLPDLTPVTNTAFLDDGLGALYSLEAAFQARSSNLATSFKRASPAQAAPGDDVAYIISVYNSGAGSTIAQMRDVLPPELTFVPGSLTCGSGSCGYASGTITWTGMLGPYHLVPVNFHATVPASAAHNDLITNTAIITDLGWMTSYQAMAKVTVSKPADVWVNKSGSWAQDGSATYAYTLTYGNAGPYDADDPAQVIDVLPSNAVYLGSTPPGVYSPTLGTVAWDVGALTASVSGTLSLSVEVPAGTLALTILTNTASISSLPQDPDTANNTTLLVARNPDLSASFKQALPAQVSPNDLITYTIHVHNSGVRATTGEMRDELPPELTYVPGSLVCGAGSCGYASGVITWTGTVSPHATVPIQFQTLAPADAGLTHLITNTAIITDLAWGTSAPVMAQVLKAADLWVLKSANPVALDDAALVYTLTYGNLGPYDATSLAQVVDTLPDGVTYLASAPSGVHDPALGTVTWNVGALKADLSGTLRASITNTLILSVRVPAGTPALTPLTNSTHVSPIPQDPDTANNADEALTIVNLFRPTKTAHPSEVAPGNVVTYTLTLTNNDAITITAHLTDPLPAGAAYVLGSSAVNGDSIELYNDASNSIEWQGAVPPNSATSLRFQAQITAARGTVVSNTVRVEHIAGIISSRQAAVYVVPYKIYLPLVTRLYHQ